MLEDLSSVSLRRTLASAGAPLGPDQPARHSPGRSRDERLGQAVEEPSRVHCVGDVPAQERPHPGKVDRGRATLDWGWGADALVPSPSSPKSPSPRGNRGPRELGWLEEKGSLLGKDRGGGDSLAGEASAAEAAGPFKRPGWLCGDPT